MSLEDAGMNGDELSVKIDGTVDFEPSTGSHGHKSEGKSAKLTPGSPVKEDKELLHEHKTKDKCLKLESSGEEKRVERVVEKGDSGQVDTKVGIVPWEDVKAGKMTYENGSADVDSVTENTKRVTPSSRTSSPVGPKRKYQKRTYEVRGGYNCSQFCGLIILLECFRVLTLYYYYTITFRFYPFLFFM